MKKNCPSCTHDLDLDQFDLCDHRPDGRSDYCSVCTVKYPHLSRARCRRCGTSRHLSKFPDMDRTKPCLVCAASAPRADDTLPHAVICALESAGLVEGGPVQTVTAVLRQCGLERVTREDIATATSWLQAQGFKLGAACGVRGYRVTAVGNDDPSFVEWAERYNCVDALGLTPEDKARYMRGVTPPLPVRLAMSALAAGLPAWPSK